MIQRERILNEFVTLASVSSPSFGERAMADLLRPRLEALGFAVEEDTALAAMGGNAGNLHAYRPGEAGGEPLLFSAHMDTVKPCENKHVLVDPDGRIHTDGTTVLGGDDLTGVVELLQAIESCLEDGVPLRPLEILFSVSEEYFLKGAEHFDCSRLRAEQVYVLDVDGEIGTAVIGAPTGIRLVWNVHGTAAHAALAPEEGISAIAIAAQAISRMSLGRIDADTTANIGIIRGGSAGNIVPDSCFVEGETRSLVHEKALAQCAHMEAAFRTAAEAAGGTADLETTQVYHAYAVAPGHPLVQRFQRACAQVGLTPRLVTSTGGSDNSIFSGRGLTGIILATGMHRIHSVEEYTTLDELEQMTRLVAALIQPDR